MRQAALRLGGTLVLEHVVSQGDCISSIAEQYGLAWSKVWNDPANAELRCLRKNPNVLFPGDVVRLPERQSRDEEGATGLRHSFKKTGALVVLRLRLLLDGRPRRNRPYRIIVDGIWKEGRTDSRGFLELSIPGCARSAKLCLTEDGFQDIYDLCLGSVDPISTESGAIHRLANLGYPTNTDLPSAIRAFQISAGLEATGRMDAATQTKLEEAYGL
ncbi:MAG TPA: hypothetical protein DEP35_16415 [Deltaproteobacteria bacterium]|nr:hypothetical protein [Deltaproteobacteria bacterium]